MSTPLLSQAARLSDQDLTVQVKRLAHQEREATAVLIAHLAVLDERRLYLAEGCSSLFTYCTQVLHLSEHAAYGRIEAARAARKFPIILEQLSDGSVNLTTVGLLAPHLTAENHGLLLEEARHRSKRQVEELVARLQPQSPVPSTIRRLPILRGASGMVPAAEDGPRPMDPLTTSTPASSTPAFLPPSRRAVVEPLAPRQYRVQFTADAETYQKLRQAQDLLRHQIPDGDLGKVVDQALTALLKDLGRQKHAAADRPRKAGHSDRATYGSRGVPSRRIPAAVKQAVWVRDGGRCAFIGHNGRRCTERAFLEFHHVIPYAAGGEATADNIQLRCRAHNGYEAKLFFGRGISVVRESHTQCDTRDILGRSSLSQPGLDQVHPHHLTRPASPARARSSAPG